MSVCVTEKRNTNGPTIGDEGIECLSDASPNLEDQEKSTCSLPFVDACSNPQRKTQTSPIKIVCPITCPCPCSSHIALPRNHATQTSLNLIACNTTSSHGTLHLEPDLSRLVIHRNTIAFLTFLTPPQTVFGLHSTPTTQNSRMNIVEQVLPSSSSVLASRHHLSFALRTVSCQGTAIYCSVISTF